MEQLPQSKAPPEGFQNDPGVYTGSPGPSANLERAPTEMGPTPNLSQPAELQGQNRAAKNLLAEETPKKERTPINLLPNESKSTFQKFKDDALGAAADFGIGLYYGALESAGGLAQKVISGVQMPEFTKAMGQKPSKGVGEKLNEGLAAHIKDVRKEYNDTGFFGGPGRIAGNLAGTLPLSPALKGLGQLPQLGNTVGQRIGLAGVAGAGQGALVGGTHYDESDPNSKLNVSGAATGAAVGGVLGGAMGVLPALRSRSRSDEVIKDAYNNVIKGLSEKVAGAKSPAHAESMAIQSVQKMAQTIKGKEKTAWETLLGSVKDKPVDPTDISMLQSKAKAFLGENAEYMPLPLSKWVQKHIIENPKATFGQLKELRTLFRDRRDSIWKQLDRGDVPRDLARKSSQLYDDMTSVLQTTADKAGQLENFAAANAFSKEANRFHGYLAGDLAKIAVDKSTAAQFMNKVLNRKSSTLTSENLDLIGGSAANTIRAKELKDIMFKSMSKDSSFNLTTFFNETQKHAGFEGLLKNSPQLQAMQGLQKVVNDWQRAGAIDMGTAANMSPMWKAGNKLLGHLTSQTSGPLRKHLIQYGLIQKNEKLKQYIGNQINQKFLRMGITFRQDDEGNVIDTQERSK